MKETSNQITIPKEVREKMQSQYWRICNLYWIRDKKGKLVKFQPTYFQKFLLKTLWFLNIILKARQLGFSTVIDIYLADEAIFKGMGCGIIDHTLKDVKKKIKIVQLAYDMIGMDEPNTPTAITISIHRKVKPVVRTQLDFELNNGGFVSGSTTFRGGTLQRLHITEYAKICKKRPADAEEIQSGALESVAAGQMVFIESTGEDAEGDFYEKVKGAYQNFIRKKELNRLQYKFFFFAWWENPEYEENDPTFAIPAPMQTYFKEKEQELGFEFSHGQKVWYVLKKAQLRERMFKEHPTTWEEAFKSSRIGTWYYEEIEAAYAEGRVSEFPIDPSVPIDTFWDIGHSDWTVIGLVQKIGLQVRIVDYISGRREHISKYIAELKKRGYTYGNHYLPHDADNGDISAEKTVAEQLKKHFKNVFLIKRIGLITGIQEARKLFAFTYFRESVCGKLLEHLEKYPRKFSTITGGYVDEDVKNNKHNHAADMYRYMAVTYNMEEAAKRYEPAPYEDITSDPY